VFISGNLYQASLISPIAYQCGALTVSPYKDSPSRKKLAQDTNALAYFSDEYIKFDSTGTRSNSTDTESVALDGSYTKPDPQSASDPLAKKRSQWLDSETFLIPEKSVELSEFRQRAGTLAPTKTQPMSCMEVNT